MMEVSHKEARESPKTFLEKTLTILKALHTLAENCVDEDMLDDVITGITDERVSHWATLPLRLTNKKSCVTFHAVINKVSDEIMEACDIIDNDYLAEMHGRLDIDLGNGNEPVACTLEDACIMLEEMIEDFE